MLNLCKFLSFFDSASTSWHSSFFGGSHDFLCGICIGALMGIIPSLKCHLFSVSFCNISPINSTLPHQSCELVLPLYDRTLLRVTCLAATALYDRIVSWPDHVTVMLINLHLHSLTVFQCRSEPLWTLPSSSTFIRWIWRTGFETSLSDTAQASC